MCALLTAWCRYVGPLLFLLAAVATLGGSALPTLHLDATQTGPLRPVALIAPDPDYPNYPATQSYQNQMVRSYFAPGGGFDFFFCASGKLKPTDPQVYDPGPEWGYYSPWSSDRLEYGYLPAGAEAIPGGWERAIFAGKEYLSVAEEQNNIDNAGAPGNWFRSLTETSARPDRNDWREERIQAICSHSRIRFPDYDTDGILRPYDFIYFENYIENRPLDPQAPPRRLGLQEGVLLGIAIARRPADYPGACHEGWEVLSYEQTLNANGQTVDGPRYWQPLGPYDPFQSTSQPDRADHRDPWVILIRPRVLREDPVYAEYWRNGVLPDDGVPIAYQHPFWGCGLPNAVVVDDRIQLYYADTTHWWQQVDLDPNRTNDPKPGSDSAAGEVISEPPVIAPFRLQLTLSHPYAWSEQAWTNEMMRTDETTWEAEVLPWGNPEEPLRMVLVDSNTSLNTVRSDGRHVFVNTQSFLNRAQILRLPIVSGEDSTAGSGGGTLHSGPVRKSTTAPNWVWSFDNTAVAYVADDPATALPGDGYYLQGELINPASGDTRDRIVYATAKNDPDSVFTGQDGRRWSFRGVLAYVHNVLGVDDTTRFEALFTLTVDPYGHVPLNTPLWAMFMRPRTVFYDDPTPFTNGHNTFELWGFHTALSSRGEPDAWSSLDITEAGVAPTTTLIAVANATVVANDTTAVITWTDQETTEHGYLIERAVADGPFALLANLRPDAQSYTDEGLVRGETYRYRVRAWRDDS